MNHFQTERLICRHADFGDEDFFIELLNNPDYIRFVRDRGVKDIKDATKYIQNQVRPQIEEKGYGAYLMIEKGTGAKIGIVGLFHREGLNVPDIGFSMLSKFYKKGFMLEAATKMMELAFKNLPFDKICAITVEENKSSRSLIEKLGMQLVQTDLTIPNDDHKLYLYELTAQQYQSQKLEEKSD